MNHIEILRKMLRSLEIELGQYRKANEEPEVIVDLKREIAAITAAINDIGRVEWLEAQFDGHFRNSMFIANPLGDNAKIVIEPKDQIPETFRGNSVREAIDRAMKGKNE